MKRGSRTIFLLMVFIVIVLADLTLVSAQNIYQQDSLELELEVQGSLELTAQSSSPEIEHASTEVWLFPQESYRQKILELNTLKNNEATEEIKDKSILFSWKNPRLGLKEYGYTAKIKTLNKKNVVTKKISYPLEDINGYEQYTWPSSKIDSNHPLIIAKAKELTAGEDDLFKVIFNLASWVSENVKYDLNELTTNTAQKASWVLEHREGVCDEMTSLFVAMTRSLGIPARFVSGISYTENPQVLAALGKNWAGHGWAEVYFPEVGWVSFDIAFDEFGYIDVTHLKLREGLDPDETATKFEWLADRVDLKSRGFEQKVNIIQTGNFVPEAIQLETEILALEVDYGSYNLITGKITNQENNYAVTTLRLSGPKEVEIIGPNKKSILLKPQEVRETSWIVKIQEDLEENYWYEFPLIIYSEKNITAEARFKAKKDRLFISRAEIEELMVSDEEKSYSTKININCDYLPEIKPKTENIFSCRIQNTGELNLNRLSFCLEKSCEQIDLKSNEEVIRKIKVIEEEPGWHHLMVSAENSEVEKKVPFSFMVIDSADLSVEINSQDRITFGEEVSLIVLVSKTSFNPPKNIVIKVKGLGIEQTTEMDELSTTQEIKITFPGKRISFKNKILVLVEWKDGLELRQLEKEITLVGESKNASNALKMVWNSMINFLS